MAREKDVCSTFYVDEKKVNRAKKKMVADTAARSLAETFKVLSDPTRIKLLHALLQEELCVCDIANLLGMTESAISHQLRLLRNSRLVKFRREGKMVYYTLDDIHVERLLEMGMQHASE